jgi:sec-independent protein translocase protein TatC
MAAPNYRHDIEPESEDDSNGARMGFLEHLDELRTRLIKACVALAVGMGISAFFVVRISDIVLGSIAASLHSDAYLIYTRPGEGFSFYLDLCLIGGVIVAAPFVTFQLWRFVAPGLRANEKRLVIPFLALAVAGAVAGALFSHFVLFPSMMAFFQSFDSPRMRFMPRVEDTFELYKNTLIGMVAVFQIPTLVFVLARLGLLTAGQMWRSLNYAVLVAVTAAAFLTPSPDPWNQIVFAAPIVGMYIIGIGIAWLVHPGTRVDKPSSVTLKLVFAASLVEQARRRQLEGHFDSARKTRPSASRVRLSSVKR